VAEATLQSPLIIEGASSTAEVICGDTLTVLKGMPSESVQCVITSPPYWGLRRYLFDKAAVVRYNLTQEERDYVEAELARRGIKPRC